MNYKHKIFQYNLQVKEKREENVKSFYNGTVQPNLHQLFKKNLLGSINTNTLTGGYQTIL